MRIKVRGLKNGLRAALMCGVAWGAMLLSCPAHAQQVFYKADGTTTTDLEAAAATWRDMPSFKANPALAGLRAEYAYAYGYRGNGSQLGLVDTSIMKDHPGFKGSNIVPLTTRGKYAVDGTLPGQQAGKSFTFRADDLSLNVYASDYHATAMAGFAMGAGTNGYPQGVAPGATLYLARSIGQNFPTKLKAFDDGIFTASYEALVASGARAITSMWQVGETVIDMYDLTSMYKEYPTSGLLGAMEAAAKKGVLMIMPNGNFSGQPGIGSALPYFRPEIERNWLAIAAASDSKTLASYSNICAQTKWWCVTSTAYGNSNSYDANRKPSIFRSGNLGGGTSEASADALGAAGILMQRYPYLAMGEIRDILLTTARPMDNTGVSDKTGYGLIDLKAAMSGPGQLIGRFNATLPFGVTDTWSNNIGEAALIQRMQEERQELATLRATKASMPALLADVPLLLQDLLTKVKAGNVVGAKAAIELARANPLAWHILGPFLNSMAYNFIDGIGDDAFIRSMVAGALPNANGPLSRDYLDNLGKTFVDERRIAYLAAKTDADYKNNLIKSGLGTLILTGTSTYTGPTQVAGGSLVINGSIVSNVTVDTGAILAGVGKVGSTTVSKGGYLSPGYLGAGTLTVNGNLTFASGSYFLATLNQAGATRVAVTGTAALAGTVLVPSGITQLPRSHTILTSGGLNGTRFESVETPIALFGQLGYTTTSVNLSLYSGLGKFAGLGGNQVAVGAGIDASLNAGATITPAFQSLLATPTAQALQSKLSSLSGEAQASASFAFSQGMNMVLNTMLDPNGENRSTPVSQSNTPPPGASGLGMGQGTAPVTTGMPRRAVPRYALWGAGYGAEGTINGSASTGAHTTSSRVFGSAGGLDYRISPNATAGFSLGGGTVSWGLSDGLGGGSSDMLHAGLYGIARQGATYLSGGLAYGWFGGSTQRTVSVLGVERLKADTNAHNVAARLEGGMRLPIAYGMMPNASVTPYAAMQVQRMDTGSSSEQAVAGTSPFALTYGSQLRTLSRSELGARFASRTQLPDGTGVAFQARAAWAHDFDTDVVRSAAFQSLPTAAFSVAAARAAADSALLSAGVEMQLTESISLGTKVNGEFSSTTTMYSGTLNARVTW